MQTYAQEEHIQMKRREMNEKHLKELKAIILVCIKEAIAGEMDDDANTSSGAEEILRCGYTKR